MVRRGCLITLALFVALFAAYFTFFTRYFEWPGNLIAAFFGSLFAAVGLGGIGHIVWLWRDTRAFARAARHQAPADGQLIAASGPIRPSGAPLTSPFRGQPCVAYEYEVYSRIPSDRHRSEGKSMDMTGFAMAASAIDTPHGAVRLLGFPLLDDFPQTRLAAEDADRARQYAASTPFEAMHGLGKTKLLSALDDALQDADGIVRKDFRMTREEIPFEQRILTERSVGVGQQVCAVGRYNAEKRALVPRGATINRLWPGTAADVRRRIVREARSQATIGFVMFLVCHAGLGAAFYMSETRHARESEDKQASAINSAIQDHDIAALERAVRRGANPNAHDTFGDVPLLDVRDAEMAAALIRLGADVNVRHREDRDTALIRAARMGNADLVRVLLAAKANVMAETTDGASALSEAIAGGHDEVVALLRAAGARLPDEPIDVERPTRPPS